MMARPSPVAVTRVASACGAQSVPLGGVLGADWTPATGLALFWIESVALALVAVGLAALVRRDASRRTARAQADAAARHAEITRAHIVPRDIFAFHIGSLVTFGIFLAGVVFMLAHKAEGIHVDPEALRLGGAAILGFVLIGATGEIVGHRRLPATAVAARVDACTGRWAMFWMLGFFGPILVAFFGRPALFFGFFGGLKALWEVGRLVPRRQTVAAKTPLYP